MTRDIPALAAHQAAAILWYTGNSSKRLLRRLRERRARKLDHTFVEVLEQALRLLPVYDGATIYRVIAIGSDQEGAFRDAYRKDAIAPWPVLAACSAGKEARAAGNVLFVISHRTGRWIGPRSWVPAEQEVILLSGRRFRSLAYVKIDADTIEVELEELIE